MNGSGSEIQSGVDARIGHHLAEIYLAVALLIASALCLLIPPFFVPDEFAHCARGIQISHGGLIGERSPEGVGGWVDANFTYRIWDGIFATQIELRRRYPNPFQRPDGRVTEAQLAPLRDVRWAHRPDFLVFQAIAVYPPVLYLPQAAGWRIGEAADLTILHSMLLARWFAALSAVAIGWLALRLCAGGRWLLCAYLLLPTSLALNASCSQDGLLLPIAGLVTALLSRVLHARRRFTLPELAAVTGLLAVCITARPPYLPLALLLFLPALALRGASWRQFLPAGAGLLVIAGLLGAWEILVHPLGAYPHGVAQAPEQIAFLRGHLLHGAMIILMGTLLYPLLILAPGLEVMGILDVYPPLWVYALLGAGLTGIAFFTPKGGSNTRRESATLLFVLFTGFAAVSLAIYCICTPPGVYWITGLQARYYLPIVPFIFLLLGRHTPGSEDTGQQSQAISFLDRRRGRLLPVAGMVFLAGVLYTPWEAAHGFYNLGLISALRASALW
jgi:hypothetical protein